MADSQHAPPLTNAEARAWWRRKHLEFNLILFVVGITSLFGTQFAAQAVLPPGEDAVEPMAWICGTPLYAILLNVCYLCCCEARDLNHPEPDPTLAMRRRARWHKQGLIAACILTSAPFCLYLLVFVIQLVRGH
jgi:hypothetical protein